MINIKEADFLQTLPQALKKDKRMLALAQLIAEELHITANEAEKNIIYANIDTLPEFWLDILANDLHVDWYDYDYPVDAKRAILKDSVKVHQKLGTKAAVEMALGGIHPLSEIEEWFTYGGLPYRFRIVLDTTNSRVEADYDEIVKTVDIYKRLTARLDGLYYQCSMLIAVKPKTEYFLFSTGMTGKTKTGEKPRTNIVGAVGNAVIKALPQVAGYITEATRTGTKPDRNVVFAVQENEIVTELDTVNYSYESNQTGKVKTGTKPYINIQAAKEEKGITQMAEVENYQYEVKRCGRNQLSK